MTHLCKMGCGHEIEGPQYSMCKECWWNQDPRNVKNGGTVSLEKYMEDKAEYASPGPAPAPFTLNNRFVVESYKEDRGLKATVTNGFAMVSQKVQLKGLKLLVDVDVTVNGQLTRQACKGDLVYIRESLLQSAAWAKQSFTSDAIEGEFMIVEGTYIEFVVPK